MPRPGGPCPLTLAHRATLLHRRCAVCAAPVSRASAALRCPGLADPRRRDRHSSQAYDAAAGAPCIPRGLLDGALRGSDSAGSSAGCARRAAGPSSCHQHRDCSFCPNVVIRLPLDTCVLSLTMEATDL